MPKYDDEEAYDVGGDSFQKMLSDLLRGAAISAAGVCPGVAVAFFQVLGERR
jgi:riboflavin synthase alpha subunit